MKTIYTYKNLPHSFLMRGVLCLFGVFFSSQAYAQHEDLLGKTWYLYKIEIDGEEYEYYYYTPNTRTANDESRIEIMDYDINKLTATVEFDGCPGWGMFLTIEFVENEEKFILSDFGGLTLEYCYYWQDSAEHEIIEEFFFSFYHNYGSIVEYSLETINNIEFLIFTDENKNQIYYSAINLSTPDFNDLSFSISPNPVQEQLFIQMSENSVMTINVYDIQGRLMERFQSSSAETSLDVSKYASGLYFIKLTDELGIRKVKKFIKQ